MNEPIKIIYRWILLTVDYPTIVKRVLEFSWGLPKNQQAAELLRKHQT